jgi:hypothetical protein
MVGRRRIGRLPRRPADHPYPPLIFSSPCKGRRGLVDQVEDPVMVADSGRFSLRVALWLGVGIVVAATAFVQFEQAILGLFQQ